MRIGSGTAFLHTVIVASLALTGAMAATLALSQACLNCISHFTISDDPTMGITREVAQDLCATTGYRCFCPPVPPYKGTCGGVVNN